MYLAQVCVAAGAESLPVREPLPVPQGPLLKSKWNKSQGHFTKVKSNISSDLAQVMSRCCNVWSSYLSDSSEAGQCPHAAAVSDDHGL